MFARGEHGDRSCASASAQVGAFQRVHRDIHLHANAVSRRAHFLADVQHGGFIALALTDHDRAFDGQRVQAVAHGFHRRLIGCLAVAHSHRAGGCDRGILDNA